jgi:PKD repeat protein
MRISHRGPVSRILAPLAVILPLALVATALLPVSVSGTATIGELAPPRGDSGTYQQTRSGDGAVRSAPAGEDVEVLIAPQSSTVVSGQTEELTAQIIPPAPYGGVEVAGYEWSLSSYSEGALAPLDESSTTFYAGSATTPSTLTVTVNVFGWIPTFPEGWFFQGQASGSITVVPPLSASGLRASPDPSSPGEQVELSWTIAGGEPPYESNVEFGDGSSAEVSTAAPGPSGLSHVYSSGVFEPSVTVSSTDGETATTSALGSVVVSARLGASLLPPFGADEGTPLTISASVGGGTPPYSYQWSNSWGGSSYSPGTWTFTPSREGSLTIYLTVTDSDGQTVVAPAESIAVNPLPTLAVASLLPEVDLGTSLPLELQVQGGTGPFVVDWTPGPRAPTLTTEFPRDGTYAEPYVFEVTGSIWTAGTLTDALGSSSSVGATTATVVPAPVISMAATPTVATVGSPEIITASISQGLPPYSWSWSFSGPVASVSASAGTLGAAGTITWNGSIPVSEGLLATLSVVDSSGGAASSTQSLAVDAPLLATLTSPAGRAEVGDPASLVTDVFGGQAPYLLSWSASDGETGEAQLEQSGVTTLSLLPRIAGNLTVDLEVQDEFGRTYSTTSIVPVASAFDPQLTLSSDPIDTTGTTSAQLTFVGGWAPYSGTLSDSAGQAFTFQSGGPAYTIILGSYAPGPVSLRASLTDALGETATSDQVLTVDPLPTVVVTVGTTQTDVGVPVPFVVTPAGGTGAYPQVHLSFGDGNWSTAWDPDHAYGRPGNYLVNVSVRDSAGGQASSPTEAIEVVPAPSAIDCLDTVGADAGLGAAFSAEVSSGTPPFTYDWDFGDGTQSQEMDPTHAFASPGVYRVALTVRDSVGTTVSAPTLNVSVAPPAGLSAGSNRSVTEVGVQVSFSARQLGGATPASVEWSFGDGASELGWTVNHTFGTPGTFAVVAQMHDSAGGAATATVMVDVAPPLQGSAVQVPPEAEAGVPLTLEEFPSGGLGPYQLAWQLGGSQASAPGLTSWTEIPSSTGLQSGQVQIADADGAHWSLGFQVLVDPSLQANLSSTPTNPEAGLPFRLAVGTFGGAGPVSFLWSLPPGSLDPGNRSTFDTALPYPGTYPITVEVTDALGRSISVSLQILVMPPLTVAPEGGSLGADAGVPIALGATVAGGVGPFATFVATPFGTFALNAGPITFPEPGTYPVQFLARDADGAVAVAHSNLTVSPPPSLVLLEVRSRIAAGVPVPWAAAVLGGSGPSAATWELPGIGTWQGDHVNLTFPSVGNFALFVSVHDAAGGSDIVVLNVSAIEDPLSLTVNATSSLGVAPFEPLLVEQASGGTFPVQLRMSLDGTLVNATWDQLASDPTIVPVVLSTGTHAVTIYATDSLGAQAESSLVLTGLPLVGAPSIEPPFPVATAGEPFELRAIASGPNSSLLVEAVVRVAWWGPGLQVDGPGAATFLSDRSGRVTEMVSETVAAPGGPVLENITVPVVVRIAPGPATELSCAPSSTSLMAGTNASLLIAASDPYGNTNTTFQGNATLTQGEATNGSTTHLEVVELLAGEASVSVTATKAGTRSYDLSAPGLGATSVWLNWTANPDRAILRLTSWYRSGTSLAVNVSAEDVFGNPLSNLSVTAEVPGGESVTGIVLDGNVSLVLPEEADATTVVLLGPAGAQTTVTLPDPSPENDTAWGLLLFAVGVGVLLGAGILLGHHRRKRRAQERESREAIPLDPQLLEAKGTLEDIIEHLPGEDRGSLLVLAEEHGIPRPRAEEALASLEKDQRIEKKPDGEGVERFEIRDESAPRKAPGSPNASSSATSLGAEGIRP